MDFYKFHKIMGVCTDKSIELVAVSKTKPVEDIKSLYSKGHQVFGENKVQELAQKQAQLPKDIQWHFIGHLQKNKVKYIAAFVELIHAVESVSLLKEIDKRAKQYDRIIKCLLQFHIAEESSKFGLKIEDISDFMSGISDLKNIQIVGVMGMATFTENRNIVRNEFKTLKNIFDTLKKEYFQENKDFTEISMGMSGDFEIAIEEGSTMIRVGSSIFGSR